MKRTITEKHYFFLIALVGGFAILSSTMSKTPVLPLFARDLGASPEEIGWIASSPRPYRGY